jgi:hypothetical protein
MGAAASSKYIFEYSVGTLADHPNPPMPAGGERGSSFVSGGCHKIFGMPALKSTRPNLIPKSCGPTVPLGIGVAQVLTQLACRVTRQTN